MLGKPASKLFVGDWLISQEQVFKITKIAPMGIRPCAKEPARLINRALVGRNAYP
jgi:hypothetical protein